MADTHGKIIIRPATQEDKSGIFALDPNNEIYGGADYLPSSFDEFIQDEQRELNVACLNGKIVSFKMIYFMAENYRHLPGYSPYLCC